MPYGKSYRQMLIVPVHPGQGISDEKWEKVFGGTIPKGKIMEKSECDGCFRYMKQGKNKWYCAFGEEFGSSRCGELRKGERYSVGLKIK